MKKVKWIDSRYSWRYKKEKALSVLLTSQVLAASLSAMTAVQRNLYLSADDKKAAIAKLTLDTMEGIAKIWAKADSFRSPQKVGKS